MRTSRRQKGSFRFYGALPARLYGLFSTYGACPLDYTGFFSIYGAFLIGYTGFFSIYSAFLLSYTGSFRIHGACPLGYGSFLRIRGACPLRYTEVQGERSCCTPASPRDGGTQNSRITPVGGTPAPCLPPAPKAHFWVLQRAGQAGGRCWGGENGAVWVRAVWKRQARPSMCSWAGRLVSSVFPRNQTRSGNIRGRRKVGLWSPL